MKDFTMSSNFYDVYDGSTLFQPLADRISLPIDLVNFLVAQVAALFLARPFRKTLHGASQWLRHAMCLGIGLLMGHFCFGKQSVHLAVMPMISYAILRVIKPDKMGNTVLGVAMAYLSCLHVHRQLYHTGNYSLDITGPLMVITQRVTSLAYSVQDELTREREDGQKDGKTPAKTGRREDGQNKIPGPLEYFSYTLAFQTLMCGPVVFYTDYMSFIQGECVGESRVMKEEVLNRPSPRRAVAYKLAGSVAAALLYLSLNGTYELERLAEQLDSPSEAWSLLYTLWFAYAATLVVRCKYYHAWLLADAICNNSGMGFNGYDTAGRARWDKLSNIDILGFELGQNFRDTIAAWNKNTNVWLRCVAYERGGDAWRTARVYALSAVWHGFYPGYYLTFMTGGLFTVAARKVRKVARPVFVHGGGLLKLSYDLLSFLTTRVCMTYATVPFVLLHLGPSLAFYGKFYYSLHFVALGTILIPTSRRSGTKKDNAKPNEVEIKQNGVMKQHNEEVPSFEIDSKSVNGNGTHMNGTRNGKTKLS